MLTARKEPRSLLTYRRRGNALGIKMIQTQNRAPFSGLCRYSWHLPDGLSYVRHGSRYSHTAHFISSNATSDDEFRLICGPSFVFVCVSLLRTPNVLLFEHAARRRRCTKASFGIAAAAVQKFHHMLNAHRLCISEFISSSPFLSTSMRVTPGTATQAPAP